jgi:hypothetical protein
VNFNSNIKAFLNEFPIAEMSGHQKFLAVASLNSDGKPQVEVNTRQVQEQWPKSQLRQNYNSAFYERAQREGWVDPVPNKRGTFSVTHAGLDHLGALAKLDDPSTSGEFKKSGGLVIVNRKATHTFDKCVRRIFASAKSEVLIADAWVDDTIFDTVLDSIPRTVPIKLLYDRALGSFLARAVRFGTEYTQFAFKRYKHLHDRFMVVDDGGYVLGPSIKDAASNSPALVVELEPNAKRLLRNFFNELWQKGTT